jgi:hypothetical protein
MPRVLKCEWGTIVSFASAPWVVALMVKSGEPRRLRMGPVGQKQYQPIGFAPARLADDAL